PVAGQAAGRVRAGVDGVRRHGTGEGARAAARGGGHRYAGVGGTGLRRPVLGTAAARNGGERDVNRTLPSLVKLLVFAAVTILLTGYLAHTLGPLWSVAGTEYRARFTDVTGVLAADDVRIARVRVGQVTGIPVVRSTQAELT